MLHLHGFHHRELCAALNGRAFLDGERHDCPLHRRPDCQHAIGKFGFGARLACFSWLFCLSVGQHGQRIDGIDLGAGSGLWLLPGSLKVELWALLRGSHGKC